MANKFAVANGNFNATSTWSDTPSGSPGASVPVAGDNAYGNSKTVTITANATCDKISTQVENGAVGAGTFILNGGVILTANVVVSSNIGLTTNYTTPTSSTINGNVTAGTSVSCYGVYMNSTGTLIINGNVTGGTTSNTWGIYVNANCNLTVTGNLLGGNSNAIVVNAGTTNIISITGTVTGGPSTGILFGSNTGTLNVTGNVYGSATNGNSYGVSVTGIGTVNIIGNVYGGAGSASHGINTASGSPVTITGTVYGSDTASGGYGVQNNSTATINIIGNAVGGRQMSGAINLSSGTLKVIRAVGNGHGLGSVSTSASVGVYSNIAASLTYVEEIEYGELGQSPTLGPIILTDKTSNVALVYRPSLSKKTLIDAASVASALPAASDVRYGIPFNLGVTSGTCYVPVAGSVALGIPVDNTTGTAILTAEAVWGVLTSGLVTVGSIGERLKTSSTVATTGSQLAAALSP